MGDCDNCKARRMDSEIENTERYSFEYALAVAERTIKRLWISTIILIFLLVGTNLAWLYYESQFETIQTKTETEILQENSGGYNNYIGNNGDINNPDPESEPKE